MPRRKHLKKGVVTPRTDANQNIRESQAERARVADALAKRYERLRNEYMEEMKRREEEKDAIGRTLKENEEKLKEADAANE